VTGRADGGHRERLGRAVDRFSHVVTEALFLKDRENVYFLFYCT
jgi:hypothetical protein